MQRPDILRNKDTLTQSLVMFKTQSFQNFNLLYDAYGNLRAKSRDYRSSRTDRNRAALAMSGTMSRPEESPLSTIW